MTVVLVTGSRDHDDPSTVFRELNNAFFQPGAGDRGTTDCANYAEAQGVRVLRFDGPIQRAAS